MKPLHLSFQAFGPYVDRQDIDFTKLAHAGLFLITGETGSGKTTILDAITYALYGRSSGDARGDITTMRCQLAPPALDTEITFDFDIRGTRYRFRRTIALRKDKEKTDQTAGTVDADGTLHPFGDKLTKTALEAKTIELLGLQYDQFRQVIMLPQGQFERLLVSDSKEKEAILETLFAAERWKQTAEILWLRLADQRKALNLQKERLTAILQDRGAANLDELQTLLEERLAARDAKARDGSAARSRLEQAREAKDKMKALHDRFLLMDSKQTELDTLLKQESRIGETIAALARSRKAAALAPLDARYRSAEENKTQRDVREAAARKTLEKAVQEQTAAEDAWQDVAALAPVREEDQRRLHRYAGMEEGYRTLDAAEKALEEGRKASADAATRAAAQLARVLDLGRGKSDLLRQEEDHQRDYEDLLAAYLGNLSGIVAGELRQGQPCPVCGSLEHPVPARPLDARVTAEALEEKQASLGAIRRRRMAADEHLGKAMAEQQEQNNQAEEARMKEASLEKDYAHLLDRIDPEIRTLAALLEAQGALRASIEAGKAREAAARSHLDQVRSALAGAHTALSLAEGEAAAAGKELEDAARELERLLPEEGFTDPADLRKSLLDGKEQQRLEEQIQAYQVRKEGLLENIRELKPDLEGQARPDLAAAQEILRSAEEESDTLAREAAVAGKEAADLAETLKSVSGEERKVKEDDERLSRNELFAQALRGARGLSLQRYVLGVMLTSITNEANKCLAGVHEGRYRLHRRLDSAGNRKTGLEFDVHDAHSGLFRSVSSLSGGEKFLVALSLSIGLSTVVQAQSGGIRLDAMFVDEGFGSLDPNSIREALGILAHIRSSNDALVGIISHVESLKENIGARIEVRKNRTGNSLEIRY